MKLQELGISTIKQILSPQSPGSRGLKLNKVKPGKRYYDMSSLKSNKKTKKSF